MEDRELIRKAKSDPKEFENLTDAYYKMMVSIVKSYNLNWGDYSICPEDLLQEAMIALHEACQTYDENIGVKFSTYAYQPIKRHVSKAYRNLMDVYQNETYSYSKFVKGDYSSLMTSSYVSDNPITYMAKKNMYEEYLEKVENLPEKDRRIIELRIKNYSYNEIAGIMGISSKQVDNRLSRLRRKWKQERKKISNEV